MSGLPALCFALLAGAAVIGAGQDAHTGLPAARGGALATPAAALDGSQGVLAAALAAARADHPRLDEAAVRAQVDALAQRWRELAGADPSGEQRARAFADMLFAAQGFGVVDDLSSPEALHIDSVLARRQGYCLSLSVLALAVAEQLGEPLFGVALPNHFLVRYDDGSTRMNLELTRRGTERSDAEMLAGVTGVQPPGGIYGRSLSAAETAAVLLHNRGFVASVQGRRRQALDDLSLAARLLPELPEIHRNLGVARAETGDWPGAIAALQQALALFPADVDALLNLALARHATGDLAGAVSDIQDALAVSPQHPRARELAASWSHEHGINASAHALSDPPLRLRPGLLGSYYAGADFERLVTTRIDLGLDHDWQRGRPAPNLPRDDFSVRWEGWFRAPADGLYTWFVVANDGLRVAVGQTLVVDHWQDSGYTSFTGTGDVRLSAGFHALRVEVYDREDNARLMCMVSRDGDTFPLPLEQHLFHQAPE